MRPLPCHVRAPIHASARVDSLALPCGRPPLHRSRPARARSTTPACCSTRGATSRPAASSLRMLTTAAELARPSRGSLTPACTRSSSKDTPGAMKASTPSPPPAVVAALVPGAAAPATPSAARASTATLQETATIAVSPAGPALPAHARRSTMPSTEPARATADRPRPHSQHSQRRRRVARLWSARFDSQGTSRTRYVIK